MASLIHIRQATHHCRVHLWEFSHDTRGATAVEYGLLAGLVAAGIAGGIGALPDLLNSIFELLGQTISDNTPAT